MTREEGMKKGEILLGPLVSQTTEFFSIFGNPPIPEADATPNLSMSTSSGSFASSIASFAAFSPSCINLSAFFASFASSTLSGSKFVISPAILTECFSVSNDSMVLIPHFPSTIAENALSLSSPREFIIPKPVTTILFTGSPIPLFYIKYI